MSINRIDFQGAFMRTGDVAQTKASEDNKAVVQQTAFVQEFEREAQEMLTRVSGAEETQEQNAKFDAREKSKNEYFSRKKKKSSQPKSKEDVDIRKVPGSMSSFDIKL